MLMISMRRAMRGKLVAGLLVLGLFQLVPATGRAQYDLGRPATRPFSGQVTLINQIAPVASAQAARSRSLDLSQLLQSSWAEARETMTRRILAYIDERQGGNRAHSNSSRLDVPQRGQFLVGADALGFTIRFIVRDIQLSTELRSNSLNSYANPSFTIGFDLDATIDVDVRNNQLIAGPMRIQPTVGRPVGRNLTAAQTAAVDNLARTLSTTDFVSRFVATTNNQQVGFQTGLNRELSKLNSFLQILGNGGHVVPGYDEGTNNITLTLRRGTRGP